METPREIKIAQFADGMSPTGAMFKSLIESILSKQDDGIDKANESALKVSAGKEAYAPVLNLNKMGAIDPEWVVSLNANGTEGLNIGQGDNAMNPVLYLDKGTGSVGIGVSQATYALEVRRGNNGETAVAVSNLAEGDGVYAIHRLRTLGGEGVIFKNSSGRTQDGGAGTMTVRNDAGDLRLQSVGSSTATLQLQASSGRVGVNTATPSAMLSVNGDLSLEYHNMFIPSTTGSVADNNAPLGIFWHGSANGIGMYSYGIHRTAGDWLGPNYQQLRIAFDTGIQLSPGTGTGVGYNRSFVEVTTGKGLMVNSGNLGVGTVVPAGKGHIITTSSDGNEAAWNTGQLVVGLEAANGASSGGVGLSYHQGTNTGYLVSLSPSSSWRDLGVRARNTIFYHSGTVEGMRLTTDGRLGVGINAPAHPLHVRKDWNDGTFSMLSNLDAGANAFTAMTLNTVGGNGHLFKNSSARTADGGANTMTLRNDAGDLRLLSQGSLNGLHVRAGSGYVGIGVVAQAALSIAGDGKFNGPDGVMHITRSNILFGGANNGRWADSAVIGAGTYIGNSLNIVGMSSNNSATTRRVDIWAEAGLYLYGGMGISSGLHNTATRPAITAGRITGELWGFNAAAAGADDGFMRLSAGGGTSAGVKSYIDLSGYSTVPEMNCNLVLGTSGTERVRIDATGKMGINTNAPKAQLHVASNGRAVDGYGLLIGKVNDMIRSSSTPGEVLGVMEIGFAGWRDNEPNQIGAKITAFRLANYGAPNSHLVQSTELGFFTGPGAVTGSDTNMHETCFERMRIKADGSVGIGTSNPAGLLHLLREADGGIGSFISNLNAGGNAHALSCWQTNSGNGWIWRNSSNRGLDGTPNALNMRNDGGDLRLQASGAAVSTLFLKSSNGNVGINTSDPNMTLDVNGNICTSGNIFFVPKGGSVAWDSRDGIFWHGEDWDEEAYGIYRTPGPWTDPNYQQLRLNWHTGIELSPSHVVNGGYGKSFVNVITGKGLMVSSGNLGVGTTIPAGKGHIVTADHHGDTGGWDSNFFVVGKEASSGPNSGGVGICYHSTIGGVITSLSPNQAWRNLTFRGDGYSFHHGGGRQLLRMLNNGNVCIGEYNPKSRLDLIGGPMTIYTGFGNGTARPGLVPGRSQFEIGAYGGDPNNLAWDDGFLRLSAGGGSSVSTRSYIDLSGYSQVGDMYCNIVMGTAGGERMRLKHDGMVGIANNNPLAPLSIGKWEGKEDYPDGSMHITNDCILFGGNNAGKEANSAQISAARHAANSLCIVGMSTTTGADRRVDMWAESGFTVYGNLGINIRNAPYPIYINNAIAGNINPYGYTNRWGANYTNSWAWAGVSLWANDRIVASEFNAISDLRTKRDITSSDTKQDLERLKGLRVVEFYHRDNVTKGNLLQKGVIAQEVETVFPEAVSKNTEYIPDIFEAPAKVVLNEVEGERIEGEADPETGLINVLDAVEKGAKNVLWVTMSSAHKLKTGDKIRLYTKQGLVDKEVKVKNTKTFSIEGWSQPTDDLFVYGRQVNDFRVVDYGRLFTLGLSATQALNSEVESLRAETAALKAENARLSAQVAAILSKLGLEA